MSETLAGGCQCGQVRYRMPATPEAVNCCHCELCQELSGSAFAINAMVPTGDLVLTSGVPIERHAPTAAPGGKRLWSCDGCGTTLYASNGYVGDSMRFVRAGTLDDPKSVTPGAHFFVRNKLPWVVVPDGVTAYDTLPPRG